MPQLTSISEFLHCESYFSVSFVSQCFFVILQNKFDLLFFTLTLTLNTT